MATAATQKVADIDWFHTLAQDALLPLPLPVSHPWTSAPSNTFFVRGPHYLKTKAKVPGGEPLLQPVACDLIKHSSKISNIMEHPLCRVRAALDAARKSAARPALRKNGTTEREGGQEPFVWAFNVQLPCKEQSSLVMYYVSFEKPEKGSLVQRFLDGDDAFRSERLKLLVNIPEGPRVVKLAVGEGGSVCMVGKILKCKYTRGEDYMEVDVDIGSSVLATAAFQLCAGFTAHAVIDVGLAIEGKCQEELPERILGAVRFPSLDFSSARPLECSSPNHECAEKGKQKAPHKGLWKSLFT